LRHDRAHYLPAACRAGGRGHGRGRLQHKARKLYVELQKEQATAKQLEIEWGQLQLEQGTWSTHARIERIATRELNLRLPVAGRIEVVQPSREGGRP